MISDKRIVDLAAALREGDDAEYTAPMDARPPRSFNCSWAMHPCLRYVWYRRYRWEDMPPIPAAGRMKMWSGRTMEPAIIERLRSAAKANNMRVVDLPTKYLVHDNPSIAGYMDAALYAGSETDPSAVYPIEIKDTAQIGKVDTAADIMGCKEHWWHTWLGQLEMYCYIGARQGKTQDKGIMVLHNRGEMKILPVSPRTDVVEERVRQLKMLEDEAATLKESIAAPSRIQYEAGICDLCMCKHICEPDIEINAASGVIEDTHILSALNALANRRSPHAEYVATEKELKTRIRDWVKTRDPDTAKRILYAGNHVIRIAPRKDGNVTIRLDFDTKD